MRDLVDEGAAILNTEAKKSQPDPHSLAEMRRSVITGGWISGDFGGATQRNHDEVVLKRSPQKNRQGSHRQPCLETRLA